MQLSSVAKGVESPLSIVVSLFTLSIMPPKDYVARGRAKKKKAPPPSPIKPWMRIAGAAAVVGIFVFALFGLKDKAEDKVAEKKKAKPVIVEPLPEMPEEQWEFIESLPNHTVEVEVPEQQQSNKRYLMQCGSFRSAEQAEEMRARIAFQGLEAQVRQSEGQSGTWHRVILGPYTSKRAAEKHRHKLQRIRITTCRIWLWK